ncbi:hypothetical protein I7I53_07505 [Histoplasma capsulatum var. duboisii H88]|uniref:Uncharacterized protein n=1 Tax=Ajellomyces capsulatus (strain H88) TaxID=544711 RepID=A0A8A1LDW6_AJEC8|nr:hypothetical protein I7I53_07505 [Histoplasma capsulatum var. duboisii H88]
MALVVIELFCPSGLTGLSAKITSWYPSDPDWAAFVLFGFLNPLDPFPELGFHRVILASGCEASLPSPSAPVAASFRKSSVRDWSSDRGVIDYFL